MVSTFGQVNYLGGFVAYLIFPSALLFLTGGKLLQRLLSFFAFLFMIAISILVNQMGILLGLFAGGIVGLTLSLIARGKGRRAPRRLSILFLCIAMMATATAIWRSVPDPSVDTSLPSDDVPSILSVQPLRGNSIEARVLFWAVGLRMLTEHPLAGIGLGNYRSLYPSYEARVRASRNVRLFDDVRTRTEVAHNDYVQIAAEMGVGGILGMVAFLGILGWIVWAGLHLRDPVPEWTEQTSGFLLLAAGVVTILTHALVSFPMHIPSSRLVMVGLLGLLFCPYFGMRGSLTVAVPHTARKAMVIGLVLLSATGAVFAARDLGGVLLFSRGRRQLLLGDSTAAAETLSKSVALSFSPKCATYYLGMA